MDALKPFFPFVFANVDVKEKDVNSLVISIIVHLVAGLVVGFVLGFAAGILGGILGILGWIVAIIISSVPLYCGFALSASVVLRKKGKSKLSFAVQFAGFAGAALALILFSVFYGNLLRSLN
jgi:hypothetical protein